jgi:phosphoglycerol transferase MdoB-like AlkP superfamily enzyme
MAARIREKIKKLWPAVLPIAGSFVISAGWNYYHIRHVPVWRFIVISLAVWLAAAACYFVFKKLFVYFSKKFNRHTFWQEEFVHYLDELFFLFSMLFVVFFLKHEWISLIYFTLTASLIFWRLQQYLSRHPDAKGWLIVNKSVFVLVIYLFILLSFFQYAAFHYYILDTNIKFYNIVLFRSWAMSMFWVLGFSVISFLHFKLKSRCKYVLVGVWSAFFILFIVAWLVNIGIMYFSGLYLGPIVFEHVNGSGGVIWNRTLLLLIIGGVVALGLFVLVLRTLIKSHRLEYSRHWMYYNFLLAMVAVLSLIGLSSFRNSPEASIVKSFWDYWQGTQKQIELSPSIWSKLERFGIKYDQSRFYLAHKDKVYEKQAALLPEKFKDKKPNVIIVFLESFSSRLTSVYNKDLPGLTPGLEKMAADARTTIFKKYYNASTPTVTGLMSQLCSILPPTGHNEIEQEKKMQRHHLLCLPKILRERDGYDYSAYITAVEKDFAHKDTIFESMGTDEVFGTQELAKLIKGEPLSWGYSDHQMFPVLWDKAQTAKQPYLLMLSTVDTHPPFNLAKDVVPYGDGKNDLLNSFHTTDDAFSKFWDEFRQSSLADNTILIAVGDHAIFPGALTKDIFPADAGKINFYDENAFLMYVPDNILPKEVDMYSSALDFAPTVLQMLGVNTANAFEGHSIFDDRAKYQDILGMHEFGLFIDQADASGKRTTAYAIPTDISCTAGDYNTNTSSPLTLCEYLDYYHWKRQAFEEGRFWEN